MKKKILIVDDESSARFLLDLMLRDKYNNSTAADAHSAVELAKAAQFDLILMDINLGNSENGVKALGKIRQIKGYDSTPIVAVTAYAMEKDKRDLLSAGFTEYIAKPFDKDEIIILIEKTLESVKTTKVI